MKPQSAACRKLIITADDCGLSAGINAAALDLFARGSITTVSVMMNFPYAHHALESFAAYPGLGVGVHLNLTEGVALTALSRADGASNLYNGGGHFRSRLELFNYAPVPNTHYLAQVEAELHAQIETFCQLGAPYALAPTHLTTHMHFHVLPTLRDIVLNLANEYGIPWVRTYNIRDTSLPLNINWFMKRPDQSPTATRYLPIAMPDHLIAVKFWSGFEPQLLLDELLTLSGTIELVVHPGQEQDPTFPTDVAYAPDGRAEEATYVAQLVDLIRVQAAGDICLADFDDDCC